MNDSSHHQKRNSKDLNLPQQKKKSLPISINSNPNPDQFLFKNNLSNIATSYKDIGEKIQKLEKAKKLNNSKATNNTHMFNNFLSINSKASQLSNQSTISKNVSHIISQRILPAKNLSTTVFPKGFLINAMNASKQKIAISNRNYLQAKTENSIPSNKEPKKPCQSKGRSLIKKNIVRQKSIGLLPSSGKNLKIEYGTNDDSKENSHCHRHSKVAVSNIDDRMYQMNQIKKKISKLKYSFKKFIQIPKKTKRLLDKSKEKLNTISSINNPHCLSGNDNNKANTKKRGLSHDLQSKIKPNSAHPQMSIQMKDLLPKNGRSISINQITIHPINSKHPNHSRSKEKLINNHQKEEGTIVAIADSNNDNKNKTKNQQGKIPHQPIQVHIKPLLIETKKNQHNRSLTKHPSQQIQSLEIVEDYETERLLSDHYCHNDDHYNLFDYLLVTEEDEEEDKFDDLNSIVRAIDFDEVNIKETNSFFNNRNDLYNRFEQKFNNEFELSCSKNKFSERKKMNMSLSTQENSYKKCLSPQFINEKVN